MSTRGQKTDSLCSCELNVLRDLVRCAISDEDQPELPPCTSSLYTRAARWCSWDHLPTPNLTLQIDCTYLRGRKDVKHLPFSQGGDFIMTSIDAASAGSDQVPWQTVAEEASPRRVPQSRHAPRPRKALPSLGLI